MVKCDQGSPLPWLENEKSKIVFFISRDGELERLHRVSPPSPAHPADQRRWSIVAPSGILCGTLGAVCPASLANGLAVTLRGVSDVGYRLVRFTGGCNANGETTMAADRVCGATFALSTNQTVPTSTTPPTTTTPTVPPTTSVAPVVSIISESTAREVIDAYYAAHRTTDFNALRAVLPAATNIDRRRIEALQKNFEPCDYIVPNRDPHR